MVDEPQINEDQKKGFWNTTLGIITKVTALVTALTGLILAVKPMFQENAKEKKYEPPTVENKKDKEKQPVDKISRDTQFPRQLLVPNLIALNVLEAKKTVESAGFKFMIVHFVSSNNPSLSIVEQYPKYDTDLKEGEFVGISVTASNRTDFLNKLLLYHQEKGNAYDGNYWNRLTAGNSISNFLTHHEHAHEHPHEISDHHHHPHVHPHRADSQHHHAY